MASDDALYFDEDFEDGPVWLKALDEQLDLMRWWKTEQGRQFGTGFGQSILDKRTKQFEAETPGNPTIAQQRAFMESQRGYLAIPDIEATVLSKSHTYYVTEEMADLIDAGGQAMPPDSQFRPEILPNQHGFAYIPHGLLFQDWLRMNTVVIKAVTWQAMDGGLWVCQYSDPRDPRDDLSEYVIEREKITRLRPNLLLFDVQAMLWGANLGAEVREPKYEDFEGDAVALAGDETRHMLRWLYGFWLFVQQERVVISRPHRGLMRRAQRELKIPPDETMIRVVRLRKTRYLKPDGEAMTPKEILWSHRWRVQGHWRRIHKGTANERKVWVRSYVKGPEYAPLVERDNVNIVIQ